MNEIGRSLRDPLLLKGKVVRAAAWNGDEGFVIGFEDGDYFSLMSEGDDEDGVSLDIYNLHLGDDNEALVAAGVFPDEASVKAAREEADAQSREAWRKEQHQRDLKELARLKALYEVEK